MMPPGMTPPGMTQPGMMPPGMMQPGMRPPPQQPGQAANDPMMSMLQQMMGDDPNGDPMAGLPPGLRNLFNAAQQDDRQANPQLSSNTTNVWRIIHALVSFVLATYVVLTSSYTGSKTAREPVSIPGVVHDGSGEHVVQRLFIWFSSVEVVLQSSRYFIEKGQLPQSGVLGAVGAMLPEPYATYIRIIGRYSVIFSTIASDAMVIVFVLGVVAWWRGMVEL